MALMALSPAKSRSRYHVKGLRFSGSATARVMDRRGHQQRHVQRWDAQSRSRARQAMQLEEALQTTGRLLLKLLIVALISIGFLYCASAILATTASVVIKAVALGTWACGFVPISHYLWNS